MITAAVTAVTVFRAEESLKKKDRWVELRRANHNGLVLEPNIQDCHPTLRNIKHTIPITLGCNKQHQNHIKI